MTGPSDSEGGLVRRLPPVRGRLTANAPIGPMTWFRVGGPAEALFRPADLDDLAGFLAALPPDIPVTVIGVGSNLLYRNAGTKFEDVTKSAGLAGRYEPRGALKSLLEGSGLEGASVHILQGVLFLCGVAVMVRFIMNARRVEPFTES